MNIRDYVNNRQSSSNTQQKNNNSDQSSKFANTEKYDTNDERVKNLEQDLNKYKNLSQNELLSEFMKEASKLKANGSLNDNSINALKSTLAPMLSTEQNQMLEQLLNMIK